MCPLYVAGLIGPGARKSVQPMAQRLASGEYDRLHHFVAAGVGRIVAVDIFAMYVVSRPRQRLREDKS
jgi:SRSO17 transposase